MTQIRSTQRVAAVTGASKGIGLAIAKRLAEAGFQVYDLSRSGQNTDFSHHLQCDVSDAKQVDQAVEEIIKLSGRLDISVCNAGFGISGSVEGTPAAAIKQQMDVNFLGAAYFARASLPHIRETQGRIIFMSSVAGQIPIPFQAFYSASKAALYSLALSLDNEIKSFGARSLVIMPGDLATNFTASRIKNDQEPDVYCARVARSVAKMEKDELGGKNPDQIAELVYRQAIKNRPKAVKSSGLFYQAALLVFRLLPVRWANALIGKLYA